MQDIRSSDIVLSLAGHDKDDLFVVVGCDGGYAYLVNGKGRKLLKPKRKKLKHLQRHSGSNPTFAERIRDGIATDREIRKLLAQCRSRAKK